MLTLMALGGLVLTAMLVAFVFGIALLAVKVVLMLVLLPLKLIGFALRLVLLPFKLLLGLLFLPLLLVGGILGLGGLILAGIAAVVIPLAPLLLLGVVIWAVAKAVTRPRAVVVR
jgi:hypothetical protein